MALANFFDKSAMAASEVLNGFELSAFEERLNSASVGIVWDEASQRQREANVAIEMLINLCARLYPRLVIIGPARSQDVGKIKRIARWINPAIEIGSDLESATIAIAATSGAVRATCPIIYCGADGWIAKVSMLRASGFGHSSNPFGAAVAACLASANVFRHMFADQLENPQLDKEVALSAVDFSTGLRATNPKWSRTDLQKVVLVGAGAIGNALAWTLARTSGVTGSLEVVDPQPIELSNLQRYLLAGQPQVNEAKVKVLRKAFRTSRVRVNPIEKDWGQYLAGLADWRLDKVLVAVDSVQDRMAIQASLPRWIANAWTQTGDLGVSRHEFLGPEACLMCLYLDRRPQKSESQDIAEALGLAVMEPLVRRLLYLGTPVDEVFIQQVAGAKQVQADSLMQFVGKPLRELYTRAACGGLIMRLGGAITTPQTVAVPTAFQSALAGVLLASEVVVQSAGLRKAPLPPVTRVDLLRPLGAHLSLREAKRLSCICLDADYIDAYKAKYPDNATSTRKRSPLKQKHPVRNSRISARRRA